MKRRWFTQAECDRVKRLREGGYTLQEIADRLGCHKARIGKLIRRGYRRHTFGDRPRPADLVRQADVLTFNELKAHYHVGAPVLQQWLAEANITLPARRYTAPIRPMPDDFAAIAPTLNHKELQRHYRATGATVTRWKVEAGVPTPRHDRHQRRVASPERKPGWVERYVADRRVTPFTTGASA